MKQVFLFLILFSYLNNAYTQCPEVNIPLQNINHKGFVPAGWRVLDSAQSDFNGDNKMDMLLVLADNGELTDESDAGDCPRMLLILEKTEKGYVLNTKSKKAVRCLRCGGLLGDPYEDISFIKNVIKINHYGGSNWRWSQEHIFRFQNNRWELIGMSESSYVTAGHCGEETGYTAAYNFTDVNFSTSKMHIIRTKDDACKPYKDQWLTFPKRANPVLLSNFDSERDYVPLLVK